jgi:kumamolisin
VPLSGSCRRHMEKSVSSGAPLANEQIEITLTLRRRNAVLDPSVVGRHLTHEELEQEFGTDPNDIAVVEDFAAQHHFAVVSASSAARTVTINGQFSVLADLFGASVELRRFDGRVYRSRHGALMVPAELAEIVTGVFGFDTRPTARVPRQFIPHTGQPGTFSPRQLASIYQFPATTGKGQTIGIIELGGGFRYSDLHNYWNSLGLAGDVRTTPVSVNGASNKPEGTPDSADGEVVLDIEVAGGIAPGASLAVYFAPNTNQGFLNAINTAIHDKARKPSVISISWGSRELAWTQQAMNALNQAFHDAALLGITVCVASGDDGSSDGGPGGSLNVDFPASSPWVLACGGTRLTASNGSIESETAWNDGSGGATGGGVSSFFALPSYQAQSNVPVEHGSSFRGRGVPDIAAVADPETGYLTLVDGTWGVIGGTSAVAPLWAGLVALLNENLGRRVGFLHPLLYGTVSQHKALNDITTGTNGAYQAGPGWDACTGLGTPNGTAILDVLKPAA